MRDFGAFLDGGDGREILLPTRYVPDGLKRAPSSTGA